MAVTAAAERQIRKLAPEIRRTVNRDLLQLEDNPRPRGAERLVLVVTVGDRKEVYRRVK